MSLIDRRFQLADDSASLGLHCTPDGVTLAGTPLLRVTVAGLAPRRHQDLSDLLKAAYGRDLDPGVFSPGLAIVARALNDGDLGRAMVAAVRLRLTALDAASARRLAACDEALSKSYNAQEPRDWRGRWTTGGGVKPTRIRPPHGQDPAPKKPTPPTPSQQPRPAAASRTVALQTPAAGVPPRAAVWEAFRELHPNFQSQFDHLDPVEFSRRVTRFGEWIEAQAHENRPIDRAAAKAEYDFLQNRLEFWLGYQYIPLRIHLNLISAALALFQGATNAGLVRQGDPDGFPKSFAAAVSLAMVLDGSASGRGMPSMPGRAVAPEAFKELDVRMPWLAEPKSGMGGTADNHEVGIGWGMGIDQQGRPWEKYVASKMSEKFSYMPDGKVFDIHEGPNGEAISCKTLNTLSYGYINNPNRIYATLSKAISDVDEYVPGVKLRSWDIPPERITSRTIHLAIPEETNPEQWAEINRAADLAETKGIRFIVTRIR